jgi:hypothetical protein
MSNKIELKEIKAGQTGTGLLIERDGHISFEKDYNKSLFESIENERKNGNEFFVPHPFDVFAVMQKAGIKNANGRIYSENILRREIDKFQYRIKEKSSFMELNHPPESTIDLGRLCGLITELHWEGNTVLGSLRIDTTEGFRRLGIISSLGDLLAHYILIGYKIGVSSRGLGSVENKMGTFMVADDFEIITWDVVSDPSTPNAWIGKTVQDLAMYVEGNEVKTATLLEKLEKFKDVF